MNIKLSRLKKVDLREIWAHEEYDFSKWLAQKENLDLLGDELELEIELLEVESPCGDFSIDILAKEANTDRKIIIENQLEKSNHDHLGKIITYASGKGAQIIIWIVKEANQSHQQAVDWLNEHTDESLYFFLIKVELWGIEGGDGVAPKFQIISGPNDWAKIARDTGGKSPSDVQMMQLEFWNTLKEYAQKKTSLKFTKPYPQGWQVISIGSPLAHVDFTLNSKENYLGCELYIPDSKDTYNTLFENKEEIEKKLGTELSWEPLPHRKASRIKVKVAVDVFDKGRWNEYSDWFIEWGEKFAKVFGEYL